MTFFVRLTGAFVLVLLLLYLGQWVGNLDAVPGWTRLDLEYVKSLQSEIGGSGLDALLIGFFAAFIAARFDRAQEANRKRRSLRRRRGRSIDLVKELEGEVSRLPLAGFTLESAKIVDRRVESARFHHHSILKRSLDWFRKNKSTPVVSTLKAIEFENVSLKYVRFGGRSSGAILNLCQFNYCALYFCDFRNTSLTSSAGKPPFENSKLFGCRFDGATFTEANLSNVSVRWCSFWGAKLIESHLPEGVFKALQKASCITLIENGTASYEVLTLGDILWRPTATRLWLLLRFICGSSFRGSAAL